MISLKILILGAGAIGSMLGVHLIRAHEEVTFLDQQEVTEKLAKEGITLRLKDKEHHSDKIKTITSKELSRSSTCYDLVIVAVKAYHVGDVCTLIRRENFKNLITIQNGVGNEEALAGRFGPQGLISGAITLPVARGADGAVEMTNPEGGIALAPVNRGESCEHLAGLFRRAGFTVKTYENYHEMKWSKLLLNIIGNATSAILDMSPSEIFNDRQLTRLEKRQFMEALEVMKGQGLKVVDLPGYPVRFISTLFGFSPPTLLEIIMSAGGSASRGSKMPSLHIDLSSGSMFSEVEVLNGAIAQHALKDGVDAPVNIFLYETLDGMVNGLIPRDTFKKNPEKLLKRVRS
jgi:2-dehydropantoate 2-reductase